MKNLALYRKQSGKIDGVSCSLLQDIDGQVLLVANELSVRKIVFGDASAEESVADFGLTLKISNRKIIGLAYDAFEHSVIVGLADGEVVRLRETSSEVIGSLPAGILAFAPSPDGDLTAIVSGDYRLTLMRRGMHNIIRELSLCEDVGIDTPYVSVGWGKKTTQFHGKAGKQAALTNETIAKTLEADDDRMVRISWRQDGEYFVISLVIEKDGEHRELLTFNRDGDLISINEPTEGLGQVVAWKQDGSHIAALQCRSDGRKWIVFYEKNGLRHGEFPLDDQANTVKELLWNRDGSILAILMGDGSIDLWSCTNYHWYHKYSLKIESSLVKLAWSVLSPTVLLVLTEEEITRYEFIPRVDRSACGIDDHLSVVAVVDGPKLLLTPFALVNIPPPMAFDELILGFVANSIAITIGGSLPGGQLAAASAGGKIVLFGIQFGHKKLEIESLREVLFGLSIKQMEFSSFKRLWILADSGELFEMNGEGKITIVNGIGFRVNSILSRNGRLYIQHIDGGLFEFENGHLNFLGGYKLCPWIDIVSPHHRPLLIDIDGNLTVGDHLVFRGCTSFIQHPEFLCVADPEGSIRFYPLDMSPERWHALKSDSEETTRLSEGGAQCIAVVPKSAALIIQLPRGNLETIYPRAFVISQVKKLLDALKYREAFLSCRKHRLDLNLIHDHNPELFRSTIAKFAIALPEIEHINLFITSLRDEDVTSTRYRSFGSEKSKNSSVHNGKVNFICDKLREELINIDCHRYAEPIMTTLVCSVPPNYEAALRVIISLEERLMEKSLKYLVFLVSAETLYRIALGMYNLPLALSIARRSAMDPAEYTAFLNDLHQCSPLGLQKFRIDDHLQRYDLALMDLFEAETPWEECLHYISRHNLYQAAFEFLNEFDQEKWSLLCHTYGEHEESRKNPESAIDLYCFAGDHDRACNLAIIAGLWQRVLLLSDTNRLDSNVEHTIVVLRHQKRHLEAFNLSERFLSAQLTIQIAIEGRLWSEARRVAKTHGLATASTATAALEARELILADLAALRSDFEEKSSRLETVQSQLVFELDPEKIRNALETMEGTELDDQLSTMSIRTTSTTMTSTSTLASLSRATGSRSRKKTEKQRMRGKPGSPFEREFLRDSIKEVIAKVATIFQESHDLIQFLADERLLQASRQLQNELKSFCQQVREFCDRIKKLVQAQEEKMGPEVLAALNLTPWSIPSPLQVNHSWKVAFDLPMEFGLFRLPYL